MNAGTIRLRSDDQADRDHAERETVIGEMGYQWHFGPNESKVLADNAGNRTLSANATSSLGQSVQQAVAPDVNIDDDDIAAVT
jgi:hypothetical protein